jgi:hypothetical protein
VSPQPGVRVRAVIIPAIRVSFRAIDVILATREGPCPQ